MVSQKTKIELSHDPVILYQGIDPKEWKTDSNRYAHTKDLAVLFKIAKRWKQPKCPQTDEWINKMWYIH